jgi:hypothetical protein
LSGANLPKELVSLRRLLKRYFRLIADYSKELYSVDDGFTKQTEKEFKQYKTNLVLEVIQQSTTSLSQFISFLDTLVNALNLWFEFFFSIINSLGTQQYYDIIRGKVRLEEIVKHEKVDLHFLRFNVENSVAFIYPKIKELFSVLLSEVKDMLSILKTIKSEVAEQFINELEETLKKWLASEENLYCIIEGALQDQSVNSVNKIISLANYLIDFARNFLHCIGYISPSIKAGGEYELDDFVKVLERIKGIQKDLTLILDFRREAYEHSEKFNEQIPIALWGDRETALKKFEAFARFELKTDKLIPENVSAEDLAFGLVQAKAELNIVSNAIEMEKEKIYALKAAADLLESPILKILYQGILKRIKITKKYIQLLYQNLDDLQRETQKVLESKGQH